MIVGNPPYVEYSTIRRTEYKIKGYDTEATGNLYAFVTERSYKLLGSNAQLGVIIPISGFSTSRMTKFRRPHNNLTKLYGCQVMELDLQNCLMGQNKD